ncbi:hypothetical protein COCOBI_11-0020 [Coccomyxa sp. Obi]|nr:hypothetical protein COCOBI_11-0020 [Coccomyxa sp. Obi]
MQIQRKSARGVDRKTTLLQFVLCGLCPAWYTEASAKPAQVCGSCCNPQAKLTEAKASLRILEAEMRAATAAEVTPQQMVNGARCTSPYKAADANVIELPF